MTANWWTEKEKNIENGLINCNYKTELVYSFVDVTADRKRIFKECKAQYEKEMLHERQLLQERIHNEFKKIKEIIESWYKRFSNEMMQGRIVTFAKAYMVLRQELNLSDEKEAKIK